MNENTSKKRVKPKITITKVQTTKTPEQQRDVVKRLESGGRILSLIKKAENKRVAKKKIITFLKKKGVSEHKIIESYQAYYKKEKLYEITFAEKPLGFSVIMDTRGKNAIVSSIQNDCNQNLGMKVASRVYEVNGKRVDDFKHKDILKSIASQKTPFYIVFKESKKKNKRLEKIKQKVDKGLEWQNPNNESDEEEDWSDSTAESYSSDDDEAHVAQHYEKKMSMRGNPQYADQAKKKRQKQKKSKNEDSLFKPHEMEQWDKDRLQNEQAAMLKELSRLMMGAVVSADQTQASSSGFEVDGMTHKRQNTLKTLLDVTTAPGMVVSPQTVGANNSGNNNGVMPLSNNYSANQPKMSDSRKHSVTDLMMGSMDDADYDHEIFKYLSELVGENDPAVPLTPSTSRIMKDLFNETGDDAEEVILNLPDFGTHPDQARTHKSQNSGSSGGSYNSYGYNNNNNNGYNHGNNTNNNNNGYNHGNNTNNNNNNSYNSPPSTSANNDNDDKDDDDEDVIQSMEDGTTLLKYGKYGKPKYKMFHLTRDHKYLVWYSQKKASEQTRIKIKEIRKIAIGSDSKVVEKTKKKELHETSFTIYYGKSSIQKEQKQLTVTAKNEKEAFVWAQGLKILSDAAKKGQHLRSLSKQQINIETNDDGSEMNGKNKNKKSKHHKTESVIISMDQVHKQSILNIFSKSNESSVNSLLKQHGRMKQQLQKCVDFVMTKANYKAIANAGQFEQVKMKLEDLDNRLRDVKHQLTNTIDDDNKSKELSHCKAELFSCNADLDALKQKLTAIVRRPQKL